jgi:hypothetical protein
VAARQALLSLGVDEPEKIVSSRKGKDRPTKLSALKRSYFQTLEEPLNFHW